MKLSSPIFKLKRQAKVLARDKGIPLHQALDLTAQSQGFQSWSHLASQVRPMAPSERIFNQLTAGDMLLLAARPGHGKTIMGLDLAVRAAKSGRRSHFFTLEYTQADVERSYRDLGRDAVSLGRDVIVDTSDDISADYILSQLPKPSRGTFVVIDYLQLLDQKRTNPGLSVQIDALKSHAIAEGCTIVAISQVDRAFEASGRQHPDISDVRLPNPLDLSLFDVTCFLHDGDIHLNRAA